MRKYLKLYWVLKSCFDWNFDKKSVVFSMLCWFSFVGRYLRSKFVKSINNHKIQDVIILLSKSNQTNICLKQSIKRRQITSQRIFWIHRDGEMDRRRAREKYNKIPKCKINNCLSLIKQNLRMEFSRKFIFVWFWSRSDVAEHKQQPLTKITIRFERITVSSGWVGYTNLQYIYDM